MSMEQAKEPVWPFDSTPFDIPEDRDGVNLSKCEHGWSRDICSKCNPLSLPLVKRLKKTEKHWNHLN